MLRWLVLGALAASLLVGCGGGDDAGAAAGAGPPTLSAAASLRDALTRCAPDARVQFAGSDELAAQARRGRAPDVFAAANTKLPEALAKEGLLEEPIVFASNEIVLAVPADGDVAGLDDLQRDGVRIAVGAEGVPVGDYTRTVLDRLPAVQRRAVMANVRTEEPDVKGVVAKLTQGAVDAGFVYASDVQAAGDALRAVELPAGLRPQVAYGAAVRPAAPQAARDLLQSLRSGGCQDALRDAGFGPPPADAG